MKFTITKRYPEICVGHRIHNAGTHCALLHGYARTVEVTIGTNTLDERGWVYNLGDMRFIKEMLYDSWDHKFLVSSDDPLLDDLKALEAKGGIALNIMDKKLGYGPSLEGSCVYLADKIGHEVDRLSEGRAHLLKIEIWEKTDNRASLSFRPGTFS